MGTLASNTIFDKQIGRQLIKARADLLMAVAVLGVLAVMVVPMPSAVLDFLIALNLAISVVILLVSLYVMEPIGFSVFPTLLLLLTLYRLSLNVASTRLILLHGGEGSMAAGRVIESFGQFVVGGSYVVGVVLFVVLIAIQYIVVNHGAVRISEVTARFTLDALPGKQMSIDADLNSGIIDENEARQRRKQISGEAEFYGAMDGAVRFTQRDAVASIVITLINIVAGLVLGMSQGMPFDQAIETYTVLTVGDGLVSAIPALLISVTAGIMTTRASSEANLGEQVAIQLFSDPKPVLLGAVMLILMALTPGLPFLTFFLLGSEAAVVGWRAYRNRQYKAELVETPPEADRASQEEKMDALMRVDPLGLEIGYQLIQLVDAKQGADFLSRVKSIRRQLALDPGVVVPAVHITDNLQLKPKEYRILLKGVAIARGELQPESLMAIDPGEASGEVEGIPTVEPTFNLPSLWIRPEERARAQLAGHTVVDNTTVLATHLTEVIKSNIHELLGRQEVKSLIDAIDETHPKVVEELIPKVMGVGEVQKVLQNLLRERVSIRDMVTILETLADYAPLTKNMSLLTEYVRQALGRAICQPYLGDEGELSVFTLSVELEKTLLDALSINDQDSYLNLEPAAAQEVLNKIGKTVEENSFDGYPILLTSTNIRIHIRRLAERVLPNLVVLSYNELPPNAKALPLGVVE